MFGFGVAELIIILAIIMLIFGVGKLPEIGSGFGKAIGNFKKATRENNEIDITPKKAEEEAKEKQEA